MTGDYGHTDADGCFYIDGRKKNVIFVLSSIVHPEDVEKILEECPLIREAAAIGEPHAETGETVVACVVLKDGYEMSERDVLKLFDGRLAGFQKPTRVLFLSSIPHNLSGKIQRDSLADIVESFAA